MSRPYRTKPPVAPKWVEENKVHTKEYEESVHVSPAPEVALLRDKGPQAAGHSRNVDTPVREPPPEWETLESAAELVGHAEPRTPPLVSADKPAGYKPFKV